MKRLVGILASMAAMTAFFAIAGTAAWWNGWAILVLIMAIGLLTARLLNTSPGLAEERRTAAPKATSLDRILVRLINLALPVMLLVTGRELSASLPEPVSLIEALPTTTGMATSTKRRSPFVTRLKTNSKAYAHGNKWKPDSPAVICDQK